MFLFKDKTRENLCNHLVNLGIEAEMVEKGAPEDIGSPSLFASLGEIGIHPLKGKVSDMGSIRVTGKDIDVVQVTRWSSGGERLMYEIDYAVKGHVKGNEESVTAKTKTKRGGLLRKVVDFTWIGGELAELLNADQSLKELMLREEMRQMLAYMDVEIKPDNKKPYVRIHQSFGWFPPEKVFECYDRIARHIRKLLQ